MCGLRLINLFKVNTLNLTLQTLAPPQHNLGVPKNLSKIDPGLQNQVLALRTSPGAHLARTFRRPDFSRILGCLLGCLGRSIFKAHLDKLGVPKT